MALDAQGWTILTPSVDSRVIYVSNAGNNSNDGLSSATPKQTISNARLSLRSGFPDWILLKAGDTFNEVPAFGIGGRSASEPMVLTSYGVGAKPIFTGFTYNAANFVAGYQYSNVAVVGIEFRGNFVSSLRGVLLLGSYSNFLFEDCLFNGYAVGVEIKTPSDPEGTSHGLVFRRNVFIDNWADGLLLNDITGLILDENVFDLNGFGTSGDAPTVFTHNVYLLHAHDAVIRRNIFSRGSNFGTKISSDRPNGCTNLLIENNLYYNNGLSLDHSEGPTGDINTTFTHNGATIRNNVFTETGRTYADTSAQDLATWLRNSTDVVWDSNLFVHKADFSGNPMFTWAGHHKNITVKNSVIYNWVLGATRSVPTDYLEMNSSLIDGYTLSGNEIDQSAGTYPEPTRTVGSYYASIGGANDAVAFCVAARSLSKSNWTPSLTADLVNQYIRIGFGKGIPRFYFIKAGQKFYIMKSL